MICSFCGGTGVQRYEIGSSGYNATGKLSGHVSGIPTRGRLIGPCPYCLGSGHLRELGCTTYNLVDQIVEVEIPAGCKPGYRTIFPGLGNERVPDLRTEDHNITVGNMEITISKIESTNYRVLEDYVELQVTMTPSQALDGFVIEEPYVDDKLIRIDRRGKITLPGSNSTIHGLGMPRIGEGVQPGEREDLVIRFELTPVGDDKVLTLDEIERIAGSDEEYQVILQTMREKEQDIKLRNFLTFLKRRQFRRR